MNITKRYQRQLDIVHPDLLKFPVVIVGVGGIGSWTALALAKMGCSQIFIIDPDIIESHNVASQFYKESQIGQLKVASLIENIKDYTGTKITGVADRWQKVFKHPKILENLSDYVVVCAVDSMKERRALMNYFEKNTYPQLYVDARMGGELLRLFSLFKNNLETYTKYKEKMESKKLKVHKEKCTERAVVYNTILAGTAIARLLKRFAKGEEIEYQTNIDIANLLIF